MKKRKKAVKGKGMSPFKLYILITVISLGFSWTILFYNHSVEGEKYKDQLKEADVLYKRKIYDESLEAYLNCLKINPEEQVALERVCTIYRKNRKYDRSIYYSDELIKYYPKKPEGYIYKAKAYEGKNQYKKALSVLSGHKKMKPIKKHYDEILGMFDLDYVSITEPGLWVELSNKKQVVAGKKGKNPALYKTDGKTLVTGPFTYIGYPSDDKMVIPVKEEEECFYIDEKGNRRLVPDEKFQWTGTFNEGLAPAKQEDVFGYVDRKFEKKKFEYEEAYPFFNDKAVVKKDGEYTEINKDFQITVKYEFSALKAAPSGKVCNYGLIIGTYEDREYLYNRAGERLGEGADEITLPMGKNEPVAFKEGNKWGFMNIDGSVFIGPTFEGGNSFSLGMAPVKQDGKWGYISKEGKLIIPCQFDEARSFSKDGTAWVKNHTGWSLLKLKCYENKN